MPGRFAISIICTEPGHKPWLVAKFETLDGAGRPIVSGRDWSDNVWSDVVPMNPVPDMDEADTYAIKTSVALAGDKFTADVESADRERYQFRCRYCRLTAPARTETLFPILDILSKNGVKEVSLKGLAAILMKRRRQ